MQDAVATMGGLLPVDAQGRDAVHIAVFSAVSLFKLFPGQEVALTHEVEGPDWIVEPKGTHIGIVDPFLTAAVPPGERFWVFLFPRTITGLSHRWTHPDFDEVSETSYASPAAKLTSEKWLHNFIYSHDCPDYDTVMEAATLVADGCAGSRFDGEYLHFDGQDAHGEIPDQFWDHVSIVLGRPIKGPRAKYFSCSC